MKESKIWREKIYSLTQAPRLQVWEDDALPPLLVHDAPVPHAPEHDRVLLWVPSPHASEQVDHAPQAAQAPFAL